MKNIRLLLCGVAVLCSATALSGAASAKQKTPPPVAIRSLEGEVAVRSIGLDVWEPVTKPGVALQNGSAIRTSQGKAEISCPDGSVLMLDRNSTAAVSIANDGRVQISALQGAVSATLGKSRISAELGAGQTIQEKYDPQTGEIVISCVNGAPALTMPNGAKAALTKGDIITSSPKDASVKVQAGTVEVAEGALRHVLNAGYEIFFPYNRPFYIVPFPASRGLYGYMTDPLVTTGEYTYTEEYYVEQEVSPAEEIAVDAAEVSSQPEQAVQETELSGSDAADGGDIAGAGDDGGDAGGGDSGGGDGGGGDGGGE